MKVFKYKRKFNGTTSNNIIQGRIGGGSLLKTSTLLNANIPSLSKPNYGLKPKQYTNLPTSKHAFQELWEFFGYGAELGWSPIPVRKY